MRKVLFWFIDTPAWLIGSLLASLWPIVALAAAAGVGYIVYLVAADRMKRGIALTVSIVLGLYGLTVFYQAQKWLGVQMIHQYENRSESF